MNSFLKNFRIFEAQFEAQDENHTVRITFDNGYVNFYQEGVCINPDMKPLRTGLPATSASASTLYYDFIRMVHLSFVER